MLDREMDDRQIKEAPNYTNACIVMFGVNLSWMLFAIWAVWGLIAAFLFCLSLNHLITRLQERRLARQLAPPPRPR